MSRQTECKDYLHGQLPGLAVIRANHRFHVVHVTRRLSNGLVVCGQPAEGCPLGTRLADALADGRACSRREGGLLLPGRRAEVSLFLVSLAMHCFSVCCKSLHFVKG